MRISVFHNFKKLLYPALGLVFCNCLCAQDITFEHYNDKNGLSHNSVRHIVQDDNGFLWLGTFSGLNRFDGFQFKSFLSSSPGSNKIYNDDITALELDQESNNLWIGTRNGLTLFELDKNLLTTFLPEKNNSKSLPDKEIRAIHVDKFKRVWVGTKTKGLYLFDPAVKEFTPVSIKGFDYVKEIFEDKDDNIWVGTYGTASVVKLTIGNNGAVGQLTHYSLSNKNSISKNPYINFIYEDHKDDIYVGTRAGLFVLDKKENAFTHLEIKDSSTRESLGPYFLSIARAPDGKYWVGTLGGLLVCDSLKEIPNGNFEWHYTVLSDDSSLVDNLISDLHFDASGVLWIGTEDGLDKYDPYENQFKLNKSISQHIENQVPRIRGFSKTHDEKLIVATRHNGLFISRENDFIPLFDDAHDIASIYSNDGKTFFCGLWNGEILVYDYVKKRSKIINVGFKKSAVLAFLDIGNDLIVVGSFGEGAVVINQKNLLVNTVYGRLVDDSSVNKIVLEDNADKFWFATEDGVVSYTHSTNMTRTYSAEAENNTALPHNNVSDVTIDNTGKIWAATRLGLATYNSENDKFEALSDPLELRGKWVTDIISDPNDNLWFNVNNNSIVKYRLNEGKAAVQIYHVNSGNRLDVFSSSGFYHFDDALICLASKNGVMSFSPNTLKEELRAPEPFVTEFKVQNKELFDGIEINNQKFINSDLNFKKEIALEYKNRNFSLQFSSPSYSNQRQNKFQYKLEGFDEDWVSVNSSSRLVQYTNLYPKDYIFKVRASNSNGYWSNAVDYKISILSPFWLTYKAFFLFLALSSLLIYVVYRTIRERILLRQELLKEKLKQERNEKLNNEKLRFFTNVSHELRTPLTLILGPAKDLIQQAQDSRNQLLESKSKLIHQNANRLLNLVNQVLDFRKAQTDGLDLKVSKTDILIQSKMVFDSFKELAKQKNISFHFNCEDDSLVGWIDIDKYDKILFNLISNAIKFTKNNGNVDLFIGLRDEVKEYLVIEVSDDGIGIPKASQKNIFSRFYQARNGKESTTGSGIGLSLVNSIVKRHKGIIEFKSNTSEGTIFEVKIPIRKKFYNAYEIIEQSISSIAKEVEAVKPPKKRIMNTNIKRKIVVIEDNTELRDYVVDYLSDYYKVFSAENGEEGLQLCRRIKPVLCVADVMMPVMNGLEFCKALKNDQSISHIPVILLTALSESDDKVKGFNVGADGYLVKPFDPSLLKTRVTNIINTREELKVKFSGETESEISLLTHSPIDEELMKKITALIDDKISESELTTSFLCKELGMSSSKLYRKIKELTGLAPNEFIRTIRLKKSATLLKSRRYNVSEVSDLIGFNDPLYFSRCFKKQFGFPPSMLIKDEVQANTPG